MLTIGDQVMWRGSWGSDAPLLAIVTDIERTHEQHGKYGDTVDSLPWSVVRDGFAVVTLENGHWAYGYQLEPVQS